MNAQKCPLSLAGTLLMSPQCVLRKFNHIDIYFLNQEGLSFIRHINIDLFAYSVGPSEKPISLERLPKV